MPDTILDVYRRRTLRSAAAMERAARSMPGGSTRNVSHYPPYPVVLDRGEGPWVWDIDGNRYIDLANNGLSLIHGHAYPPVVEALTKALPQGSAWVGASPQQIEFAELLTGRLRRCEQVRFTNSGTEAGMLAVKIARRATGRPLILKVRGAYHGSYSDLEAGLHGIDELPGRTLLADFGDLASFERALGAHPGEVAAIFIEPVMVTGAVIPPPAGFLQAVEKLAKAAGALFVVDDCLMLRLAPAGSAEKFDLSPDMTFLGKFVGGGLPVGVVGGLRAIMDVTNPYRPDRLHHGGSFNGNVLGCIAGTVAMRALTADSITKMDAEAAHMRAHIEEAAAKAGLSVTVSGEGSVLGLQFQAPEIAGAGGSTGYSVAQRFHLACLNEGVLMGPGGLIGLSTAISAPVLEQISSAVGAALDSAARAA